MSAMRVSRRSVIAGGAAGTVTFTLGACGNAGAQASTALKVWLPGPQGSGAVDEEKAIYEKLLGKFLDDNKASAEITIIPWVNYEEKYLTGMSGSAGPDIGYMYSEMIGSYVKQGALAAMDDLISPEAKSRLLYLSRGTYDGKLLAIPYVVGDMRVIYANMDIVGKVTSDKLPTSWEGFTELAAKVTKTGVPGMLMPWGNPDGGMMNACYFPFLWQAGGDLFTKDATKTAFNSAAGLEAANFIKNLMDSGAMPSSVTGLSGEEVKTAFNEGRVGFITDSAAQMPALSKGVKNIKFIPSLERKSAATFVANDVLIMTAKCANKPLGMRLIEHMTSGEVMKQFHAQIAAYPPIGKDEQANPSDPFAELYNKPDTLRALPIVPRGTATYNSLYQNLQQMVLGKKTPQQALADAQREGDAGLG